MSKAFNLPLELHVIVTLSSFFRYLKNTAECATHAFSLETSGCSFQCFAQRPYSSINGHHSHTKHPQGVIVTGLNPQLAGSTSTFMPTHNSAAAYCCSAELLPISHQPLLVCCWLIHVERFVRNMEEEQSVLSLFQANYMRNRSR